MAVSACNDHTVALRSDGSLWTWGNNEHGQLGIGKGAQSSSPVQIGSDFLIPVLDGAGICNNSHKTGTSNTEDSAPVASAAHVKPQQATTISTKGNVTVAQKADGSLWAHGNYGFDRIDDGESNPPNTLAKVGRATNWAAVSAGSSLHGSYAMALKADGSLWAWGSNDYGQLGIGTSGPDTSQRDPVQVGAEADWAAVSAGGSRTVALKLDGSLWTWGTVGTIQGYPATRKSPGRIGTATDWAAISIGKDYTVALKTDGSLWAWAIPSGDRFGPGLEVPVQVGTATDWAAISVGSHAVALRRDSSLWAWGGNVYGQLGDGTNASKNAPVRVGTETDWAAASAGNGHTLAIKTDGSLWAWGHNFYGQLGDGTDASRNAPVQIGTETVWVAVSAGDDRTIALKADGSLWGWGFSVADGTEKGRRSPVLIGAGFRVPAAAGRGAATTPKHPEAAAPTITDHPYSQMLNNGKSASFAAQASGAPLPKYQWQLSTDGGATWNNISGATDNHYSTPRLSRKESGNMYRMVATNTLGSTASNAATIKLHSPPTISAHPQSQSKAVGQKATFTVIASGTPEPDYKWQISGNGGATWNNIPFSMNDPSGSTSDTYTTRVLAMSDNGKMYRMVATNDSGSVTSHPATLTVKQGSASDWAAVSAGSGHTVALKADGSLWAWGQNDTGQLGDGTIKSRNAPVQVGTESDWVAIAAASYSMGLKSDGSLWAWGKNYYNGLGVSGRNVNSIAPVQVGSERNWAAVSAGFGRAAAIKVDGSLWAWGSNYYGQLGDGTKTDRSDPARIGNETDWTAISAGESHTVALKKDGSLWAWGMNADGQLGVGAEKTRNAPVRVGKETSWKAVSAGISHSLALKSDGSLWAWGDNRYLQLGDGTNASKNAPVRIGVETGWTAVSASSHSLALKSDGSLWGWGSSYSGPLGDGADSSRNAPAKLGAGLRSPFH
jgi:alpha-tubulin suppressor-like RCC1 family protein